MIENAENWQDELGCLTYLFAMVLEGKGKDGGDCQRLIDLLYQLAERMYIYIQEFDLDFVEFMLRNVRSAGLSLEEELIDLQNRLREFRYEYALRY